MAGPTAKSKKMRRGQDQNEDEGWYNKQRTNGGIIQKEGNEENQSLVVMYYMNGPV